MVEIRLLDIESVLFQYPLLVHQEVYIQRFVLPWSSPVESPESNSINVLSSLEQSPTQLQKHQMSMAMQYYEIGTPNGQPLKGYVH